MKAINTTFNNSDEGKITLNGVSGYYFANDRTQIVLIYSSGISSIFYDATPQLVAALNEKFGE